MSGGAGGAVDPALCKSFLITPATTSPDGRVLWRDAWGFHAFSEFGAPNDPARFALKSISPDTGELVAHRGYDVVSPEAKGSFFGFRDLAHDGQGHFAVSFLWRHPSDNFSHTLLLFASVDSDSFVIVNDPSDPLVYWAETISWTGKSFLVQMATSSYFHSRLLEYSPEGKLLQELPSLPFTMHTDWVQSEKRVDPVSHNIWFVRSEPSLWGIHPDGSSFPQPTPTSFFQLDASVCTNFTSNYPSVAPTPEGALVVWKVDKGLCLQQVGLDLQPNRPPLHLDNPKQQPFGPFFYTRSVAQRVGDRWWVGALEQRALRSLWVKEGVVESDEPLVTNKRASCIEEKTCPKSDFKTYWMDLRMLTPIVWEDELWLGFDDLSGDSTKALGGTAYRFVRVAPGCVYPSFYDAVQ